MTPRVRWAATAMMLLFVASLVASLVPAAEAAPPNAGDLAADCNDEGRLEVTGTMRFRGGVGVLTADCVVIMEAGSRLVLNDVELESAGAFFVVGNARNDTVIRVVRSVIDLGGALQLAPGCCAGDAAVPEQDAKIVVRDSRLRGTSVEVSASTASTNGVVRVRRSTLEATSSSTVVRSGNGGDVRVADSDLEAATVLLVESAVGGSTRVARSSLSAPTIIVAAGPGGTCASVANTPPVPCA